MKVLWIVPGFSSDESDWCIPALLDLARVISQRCELHIIALQYPYRSDTYKVYDAIVHSIGGANKRGLNNFAVWRKTDRLIRSIEADMLHAWWAYEPGWLAARSNVRAPLIVSLAGGELIRLPKINYGLARKFYLRLMLRWTLRRADVVTAGSKYLIDVAKKFAVMRRIEFAPLGVDVELFKPERESCPHVFSGHDSQELIVVNVGSLEAIKDQTMLIQAFKLVQAELPNTKLIIAGEGSLKVNLLALTKRLGLIDHVNFLGAVSHDQLPALYHSASLYAQSSLHESQGMAVLEAAACGVPIVGTNVGVVADLAPDRSIAVPVGDVTALARAMLNTLRLTDRAAEINRVMQATIDRDYALDRSADRFMNLYRDAIDRYA